MRLREAVFPDDAEAIASLDTSFTTSTVYDVYYADDAIRCDPRSVDPPATKVFPIDGLTGWRAWEHGWVACDESDADRVVGFVAWRMQPWNHHVIVWHLYVDRPARGRGAGSLLLEHAIEQGARQGARVAWLETSNLDHPAVQWYRARGFEISGADLTRYETYTSGSARCSSAGASRPSAMPASRLRAR